MTNDELIAASETAYELVNAYSKDLYGFICSIECESNAVASTLSTMHNYWQGDLYDNFAKNVKGKLSQIAAEIRRGENLKETLDQGARELKEVVEILQRSGEN